MEQLIMKSNKKIKLKNKISNDPKNLFLSWNKDDKICIPLKLKGPSNFSSKKVKPSFPKLEETKRSQKRNSNSFKLIPPNENYIIQKKYVESEQTKVNTILPKIRINNLGVAKNKHIDTDNEKKRKSFSRFSDNDINKSNSNSIKIADIKFF